MAKAKVPLPRFEGVDSREGERQTEALSATQPGSAPAAADSIPSARGKARVRIDDEPEVAPASEPAEPEPAEPEPAEPEPAGKPKEGQVHRQLPDRLGWLSRHAPGHEHAVLGGLCGLVVALLVFVVGFWQTLFVTLLVAVGVTLGQCLDGDPKIINWLRGLLSEGQGGNE